MRKLIYLLVPVFLLGGGYTYWMFNKPHEDIRKQKADIEIRTEELIESFTSDTEKADASIRDKVVLIEGIASKIQKKDEQYLVTFDDGGDFIVLSYIPLQGNENQAIEEGMEMKLKCRYAGHIINDEDFMIPADIKFEQCYVQL